MTPAVLRRAGDQGWLVELGSGETGTLAAAIREQPWAELVADVVPAGATVLVTAVDMASTETLKAGIGRLLDQPWSRLAVPRVGRTIEIPVRYDGPDLAEVCSITGLSPAELARAHAGAKHVVSFFGFAPGFAYIDGCPDELALPRRATPRTRIEAGYVAIAGNQTVVYPGGTPGGWHLIGRTDQRLWDPDREPPNRLEVGDQVMFRC
jgi:5-oxoprolinase (ATP-hydrolysing) subunit B